MPTGHIVDLGEFSVNTNTKTKKGKRESTFGKANTLVLDLEALKDDEEGEWPAEDDDPLSGLDIPDSSNVYIKF